MRQAGRENGSIRSGHLAYCSAASSAKVNRGAGAWDGGVVRIAAFGNFE